MQIPVLLPQAVAGDPAAAPFAATPAELPEDFAALLARQLTLAADSGDVMTPGAVESGPLPDGATSVAQAVLLSQAVAGDPAAAPFAATPAELPEDFAARFARQLTLIAKTGDGAVPGAAESGSLQALPDDAADAAMTQAALPAPVWQPLGLSKARLAAGSVESPAVHPASAGAVVPAQRQAFAAAPAAVAAAVAAEGQPPQPVTDGQLSSGVVPAAMPFAVHPAASSAQPAHALPASGIPQHVSSPSWGEMLGERVVWMVGQRHQGAELHLNPPALGPLEIKLSLSDGQATLTFATQHAPVREAIEAATPRLREMLAESGISLGSVSVSVGNFSQQASGEREAERHPAAWGGRTAGADAVPVSIAAITLPRHPGMVDLFA